MVGGRVGSRRGNRLAPRVAGCWALVLAGVGALVSCSASDSPLGSDEASTPVLRIPVVVHIVHNGEPVGSGANLSDQRVADQIRVLNEDYRRKTGTPGFNSDPAGADARMEFVLAVRDPDGAPTSGIRRVDASTTENPFPGHDVFAHYGHYGFWDPERYVNVWTMPLPPSAESIVLGFTTGPDSDLPGMEFLIGAEPGKPEGILVNAAHFGPSELLSPFNRGRTLTHEMGHYFGLLHLWGGGDCRGDDFVGDTPPVATPVTTCAPLEGCSGEPTQSHNYMTFAPDSCMNLFTEGQVERMRYVLRRSPRRRSLPTSPALPGG